MTEPAEQLTHAVKPRHLLRGSETVLFPLKQLFVVSGFTFTACNWIFALGSSCLFTLALVVLQQRHQEHHGK